MTEYEIDLDDTLVIPEAETRLVQVMGQRNSMERALEEILELALQGEGRISRTIAEIAARAIEPNVEDRK